MNIGVFTDTYFPQFNGISTSILMLKKQLESQGHRVYIFTSSDSHADLEREQGEVFRFPSFSAIVVPERRLAVSGFGKAVQLGRRLNLDIVHTQTEFSMGIMGKHVARRLGIPLIHTYHTMYEDYLHYIGNGYIITPGMVRSLSRTFCRQATTVIAPTEKVRRKLRSYGVQNNLAVVPTGINFSDFRRTRESLKQAGLLRKQMGIGDGDFVFLTSGRLAKEKNIRAIIEALAKVRQAMPNVCLVIVGDGPSRAHLEQLASEFGVREHVLFTGKKKWTEMRFYYQAGDIFVSASTSETQGLTYIEAIASGLPVIAKKDSCLESIIDDHVTGYLFGEDADLAGVMIDVLNQRDEWPMIVRRALRRNARFSSDHFGARLAAVYQEACRRAAPQQVLPVWKKNRLVGYTLSFMGKVESLIRR